MLVSVVTASSKNLENMDELHLPEGFRPDFHPKWVYYPFYIWSAWNEKLAISKNKFVK